jgi:hypothetical protein
MDGAVEKTKFIRGTYSRRGRKSKLHKGLGTRIKLKLDLDNQFRYKLEWYLNKTVSE